MQGSIATKGRSVAVLRSDGDRETTGRTTTLRPSAQLAPITGPAPLTRAEALNRLWDYIRAHGLQNPNDKRQIDADDVLAAVFGAPHATMFDINRHIDRHLS